MTRVRIAGIGLLAPGLPGWEASRDVLEGRAPWQPGEVALPPPALLSATERRRAGPVVRLALAVASEAAAASGLPPASLRPVFGSANGDSLTVCAILDALADPAGFVSPTQFHNSVHNAAAGYWSIGTRSDRPATCLGCHDWTFAAALMKAVAECAAEQEPVLLCVYDVPMPAPLDAKRPTEGLFGAAFVLAPEGSGPTLALTWHGEKESPPPLEGGAEAPQGSACEASGTAPEGRGGVPSYDPIQGAGSLDALALSNPAARSLALLRALARGGGTFDAPLLDGHLRVTVA